MLSCQRLPLPEVPGSESQACASSTTASKASGRLLSLSAGVSIADGQQRIASTVAR